MSSINLDFDFFDHPKVKRLIARLGRGAEVLPVRLWCYCGKYHCEDGNLLGYSDIEIEQLIGWWGQAGECVKGLDGLFIHAIEGGWAVHEWLEYQGHITAYKSKATKMRAARLANLSGKPLAKPLAKVSHLPNPLAKPLPNTLANDLPKSSNAMQCNAMQGMPLQVMDADPDISKMPGTVNIDKPIPRDDGFEGKVSAFLGRQQITLKVQPCPAVFNDFRKLNDAVGWDTACELVLDCAKRRDIIYPVKVALARMANRQGQELAERDNSRVMTENEGVF